MSALRLFAIIALVPAAFNLSPASAHAGSIAVPLCTGDGVARTVNLPLGGQRLPSGDPPGCCVKGCHAGGARKRILRRVDPAQ